MTLVLCAVGRRSIWTLVDRRLTNETGILPVLATKAISIQTTDARATLAYAGLGRTANRFELSEWTVAALRCVDRTFDQFLLALASAMEREVPRHLLALKGAIDSHEYVAAAYVGSEARLYDVNLKINRAGMTTSMVRRLLLPRKNGTVTCPEVAFRGTGKAALLANRRWRRELLGLIRAYDERRIHQAPVERYLRDLCRYVAERTADGTVGPECIVLHQNLHGSVQGGGGFCGFDATGQRVDRLAVPTLAGGFDVQGLIGAVFNETVMPGLFSDSEEAPLGFNEDERDRRLAALPVVPDEKLR